MLVELRKPCQAQHTAAGLQVTSMSCSRACIMSPICHAHWQATCHAGRQALCPQYVMLMGKHACHQYVTLTGIMHSIVQ